MTKEINFVAMSVIDIGNPFLVEGKEINEQMNFEQAQAYYRHIAVNRPSQSYYVPTADSGYFYENGQLKEVAKEVAKSKTITLKNSGIVV